MTAETKNPALEQRGPSTLTDAGAKVPLAPIPGKSEERFTSTTPIATTPERLTVRKPSEILAMKFDDSDKILGDRLLAKGQTLTILGEGGLGKTRILLFLAVCCITGRKFFNIETHHKDLRWLIIPPNISFNLFAFLSVTFSAPVKG